ncbi:hypothetical protein K502DRAFT_326220 [Neoconidiobolus thromboides FSU 785]|nr:hypothetical protein K502DRAFT_326220 [Neoconidiobolus thromboides FSU 785]
MSIGTDAAIAKTGIYRPFSIYGAVIGIIGTALMGSLMQVGISKSELIILSSLIVSSIGLCIQVNTIALKAAVDMKDTVIVTSMTSFSQLSGDIIGVIVLENISKCINLFIN